MLNLKRIGIIVGLFIIVTGCSHTYGHLGRGRNLVREPVFDSLVYIEEQGIKNAPTMVLVHGTGDLGGKIWESTITDMSRYFHVINVDLPGFGRSQKKNALYSPRNYARFLNWVIETYTQKPVILVGHSMGGAIALYYAGTFPESLDHLILVDAAGILHRATFTKTMLEDYFNSELKIGNANAIEKPLSAIKHFVHNTIEKIDNRLMPENMEPFLESEIFRETALNGNPKVISAMAMIHTDFSPVLYNIAVPTSIIWGEADETVPLRTAKLLACNIESSSLKILKGTGHDPMLQDPDLFNTVLLESIHHPTARPFPRKLSHSQLLEGRLSKIIIGQQDLQISGDFQSIIIKNSRGITLTDVTSEMITVENSNVVIENALIKGKQTALKVTDAVVMLTGVHLSGDTTIRVYRSNVDVAGSTLKANRQLIMSDYKSNIVFSVSRVKSPDRQGFAHQIMTLYKDEIF